MMAVVVVLLVMVVVLVVLVVLVLVVFVRRALCVMLTTSAVSLLLHIYIIYP